MLSMKYFGACWPRTPEWNHSISGPWFRAGEEWGGPISYPTFLGGGLPTIVRAHIPVGLWHDVRLESSAWPLLGIQAIRLGLINRGCELGDAGPRRALSPWPRVRMYLFGPVYAVALSGIGPRECHLGDPGLTTLDSPLWRQPEDPN